MLEGQAQCEGFCAWHRLREKWNSSMKAPLHEPAVGHLHRPTTSPAQHRVVGCTAPVDEDVAREDAVRWDKVEAHIGGRERGWVKVPEVWSQPALGKKAAPRWVKPKPEEPIIDLTLLARALGCGAMPCTMSEAAFAPAKGTRGCLCQPMRMKPLLRPLGANHKGTQRRGVGVGP